MPESSEKHPLALSQYAVSALCIQGGNIPYNEFIELPRKWQNVSRAPHRVVCKFIAAIPIYIYINDF
jgi:hypothetical protein